MNAAAAHSRSRACRRAQLRLAPEPVDATRQRVDALMTRLGLLQAADVPIVRSSSASFPIHHAIIMQQMQI